MAKGNKGDAVYDPVKACASCAPCKFESSSSVDTTWRPGTHASARTELCKHIVCSADTEEDHLAASGSEHLRPQPGAGHRLSWPPHQEAWGIVSLRLGLTSDRSVDALVSVYRNTLTIHIQSLPGGAFDKRMASIPVEHLVVALRPCQFKLMALSCLTDDDVEEIFCFCKDQTARNKWVYVFRRINGVRVVAHNVPKPSLSQPAPSSTGVAPAPTPTTGSACQTPLDRPTRADEIRARFLQIQKARGRASAVDGTR